MTDNVAALQPVAKRRPWLLITSLALNLLVVGMVGGAVLARHRFPGPHEFNMGRLMGDPGLRGFVQSLPRERRAVMRAAGEQYRQKMKPLRDAAQLARQDVTAALKAEPFEAAKLERALSGLDATEAALRQSSASILVAAVSLMTPAERAQFLEWRTRHERPGPPNRPDQGEPGGGGKPPEQLAPPR